MAGSCTFAANQSRAAVTADAWPDPSQEMHRTGRHTQVSTLRCHGKEAYADLRTSYYMLRVT